MRRIVRRRRAAPPFIRPVLLVPPSIPDRRRTCAPVRRCRQLVLLQDIRRRASSLRGHRKLCRTRVQITQHDRNPPAVTQTGRRHRGIVAIEIT